MVIFTVFTGSEPACASRDEIMCMGTVLSHNGGGFRLFFFSSPIAVPTTNLSTRGEIHGTGAAEIMGFLVSIKKEKLRVKKRTFWDSPLK